VAVAHLVLVRRMSRLTRTGLWLIPWLPAVVVAFYARDFFWRPEFYVDDGPYTTAQFIYNIALSILIFPSFVLGVLLLMVAGIRRLVRLRRRAV
jgi:hypothetical protein